MENAETLLQKQMKSKGEVLKDREALGLLDRELEGLQPGASSKYVNVKIKNDGGFDSYSKVLSREHMDMVLKEAVSVATSEAEEILSGKISVDPFDTACAYCPYHAACGMDKKIPGYKTRKDNKLKRGEVLELLEKKYAEGGEEDGI